MDPDSNRLGESSTKGFLFKNSSKWVQKKKKNGSTQHVQTGRRQELTTARLQVEKPQKSAVNKKQNSKGFTGENTERLKDWDNQTRQNYLELEWSLSWQVMSRLKSRLSLTVSPASATPQHCRWKNKIQSITAYFHLTHEEWHSHWPV